MKQSIDSGLRNRLRLYNLGVVDLVSMVQEIYSFWHEPEILDYLDKEYPELSDALAMYADNQLAAYESMYC